MAVAKIQDYLRPLPKLKGSRQGAAWRSYDAKGDTLYVNYKKPSHPTDSELTDDDLIIRYAGEQLVGFTVLHASAKLCSLRFAFRGWTPHPTPTAAISFA